MVRKTKKKVPRLNVKRKKVVVRKKAKVLTGEVQRHAGKKKKRT